MQSVPDHSIVDWPPVGSAVSAAGLHPAVQSVLAKPKELGILLCVWQSLFVFCSSLQPETFLFTRIISRQSQPFEKLCALTFRQHAGAARFVVCELQSFTKSTSTGCKGCVGETTASLQISLQK